MRSAELLQLPLDQDNDLADEHARQNSEVIPSARHLQQQAADRLAAHRQRRGLPHPGATLSIVSPGTEEAKATPVTTRASRIAHAVAERYAQSQSYRDFLAAEAQRAIDEANAAAEVAARSAQAITAAQQQLIADLQAQSESEPPQSRLGQPEPVHHEPAGLPPASAELLPVDFALWPDTALRSTGEINAAHSAALPKEKTKPAPSFRSSSATKADPAEDLFADAIQPDFHPTASHADAAFFAESTVGLRVRLYEQAELPVAGLPPYGGFSGRTLSVTAADLEYHHSSAMEEEESLALDEEIAFRQTPVFDDPPTPAVPIPGNLLEFPRQLVAARKARPLLAEGPLRPVFETQSESPHIPDSATAQLRIFEVDPSQISSAPPVESLLPEWSSIHLEASASVLETPAYDEFALDLSGCKAEQDIDSATQPVGEFTARVELYTAPLGLRTMAAAVDLALVSIAALGLIAVAAFVSGTVPAGAPASLAASGIVIALFALYQMLFFTLSDCTPGMRYARIALCTFTDENPSRRAMRLRVPALMLSACPAALGLLWIWLDQDQLAVHDRLTRMYQRSY